LTCKDDWRRWYEAIETTADLAGIWEYINPNIIPKPEVPQQPTRPTIPGPNESFHQYNILVSMYNEDRNKYQDFKKARAVIHNLITSSISRQLKDSHNLYSSTDLYNLLKKLKDNFTPTIKEQKIKALMRYSTARNSKLNSGPIKNWITKFKAATGLIKKLRGNY
jgi:hypothetical protein